MSETSCTPDLHSLEIPMDRCTRAFWDASAQGKLLLPRCTACQHFRWPPGPFCPHCQSQLTDWVAPGVARIYTYTIIRQQRPDADSSIHVPALVEFPEADGVRILASIVATELSAIRIGAELTVGWAPAVNATVPVFSVAE